MDKLKELFLYKARECIWKRENFWNWDFTSGLSYDVLTYGIAKLLYINDSLGINDDIIVHGWLDTTIKTLKFPEWFPSWISISLKSNFLYKDLTLDSCAFSLFSFNGDNINIKTLRDDILFLLKNNKKYLPFYEAITRWNHFVTLWKNDPWTIYWIIHCDLWKDIFLNNPSYNYESIVSPFWILRYWKNQLFEKYIIDSNNRKNQLVDLHKLWLNMFEELLGWWLCDINTIFHKWMFYENDNYNYAINVQLGHKWDLLPICLDEQSPLLLVKILKNNVILPHWWWYAINYSEAQKQCKLRLNEHDNTIFFETKKWKIDRSNIKSMPGYYRGAGNTEWKIIINKLMKQEWITINLVDTPLFTLNKMIL